jgi:ABC-type multidrug transport system fused ATPase/permease subunit
MKQGISTLLLNSGKLSSLSFKNDQQGVSVMSRDSEFSSIAKIFFQSISKREKRKLIYLVSAQILVNLIDLVGVGFLGLVGAITISGIQSQKPSTNVLNLLMPLRLDQQPFQIQVSILAISATLLLVIRTLISLWLTRKTFAYFARKSIEFSESILNNIFRNGIEKVRLTSSQELIYSTTAGCDILMIGVFAQSTVLLSDITLLVLMGAGVAILQPATAAISFLIFGLAAAYMHFVLNKKSKILGQIGSSQAVINGRKIQELFSSYREIYIANKSNKFISEISKFRRISTENQAEVNYLPILNKYFLETTLLVGALSVSAVEFAINDARSAVSGLAIFLAAGSRLAPALLRVQQNLLNIRNSLGGARPAVSRIEESYKNQFVKPEASASVAHPQTIPDVIFENVTFSYENSQDDVLKDFSLTIESGTTVALTGPSGSGKTTLVDLMLGILIPKQGEILIAGVNPRQAVNESILNAAYVPQEVQLISATLLENIALGVPKSEIDHERIQQVITTSLLLEVTESLPEGVNTYIGEEGVLLSGGQKQRIGIARALYNSPKLIAFDEPTSALDGEAEGFIAATIEALHGTATIVVIAHRLNTLKNVDKVLYLENGKLVAEGKFEDVRNQVANFDQNATSAGM